MGAIDIEHGPGTTPFFNDTVAEDRWNVQGQVRMRTVSQSTSSGLNTCIFLRSGRHILMLEFMNMESSSGDRSLKIISFTKGTELSQMGPDDINRILNNLIYIIFSRFVLDSSIKRNGFRR